MQSTPLRNKNLSLLVGQYVSVILKPIGALADADFGRDFWSGIRRGNCSSIHWDSGWLVVNNITTNVHLLGLCPPVEKDRGDERVVSGCGHQK